MRRFLVCTLALAAGSFAACDSAPTSPQAEAGPTTVRAEARSDAVMSVTGSGHRRLDPEDPGSLRRFTISAIGHADGSASGQYNLVIGPNDIAVHGTVTCVNVVGNRAFVGGTVDRALLPYPPEIVAQITGVAIELVDNGTGPDAPADEISSTAFYLNMPEGPQQWCDDATPGGVGPIEQGNITVR